MTPAQIEALPTAALDRPFIFLIKLLIEGKFYSVRHGPVEWIWRRLSYRRPI